MTKLVTIITPCFNAAATLAQTIESVMAQSYTEWELLVIDDCSKDNSGEIAKNYAGKCDKIKYFRTDTPSGSPAMPRNIGIEKARGEYIAFLDSDDVWFPDKLKKQMDFINTHGGDLIYSYYEKMDWEGKRNNRVVRTPAVSDFSSNLRSCHIPCLTAIVSRKAIGDIRFKPIRQEDYCFWLDILRKGYTAFNICQVTSLYREAPNSRSANKFNMFKAHWNILRRHQNIPVIKCCFFIVTYAVQGIHKYFK